MKNFHPIQVGDVIPDTAAFGTVTVQDIYTSPRTQKILYEIVDDEHQVFWTDESELRPNSNAN